MVLEKKISRFNPPIFATKAISTISLTDVYNEVISDAFKEITEKLRNMADEKEARDFKRNNFSWITPSGIFSKREENNLSKHSSIICADLDYVEGDLDEVKKALINDPCLYTLLLFVSPSGKGLKWFVDIDLGKGDHRTWYLAIANYIRTTYGLEADMKCKDVSRACFLCYDPQCYACSEIMNKSTLKFKNKDFDLDFWANVSTKENYTPKKDVIIERMINASKETYLNTPLEQEVDMVCQTIEYYGIDMTNDYEDWRNIGFALAEGLGENGRSYYHRLSRQCISKYNESECNKAFDYYLRSAYSGTRIGIGTFFDYAKKAGINIGTIARECNGGQTHSQFMQNAKYGETALANFNHKRPTFCNRIDIKDWPLILHPILKRRHTTEYNDMTFIALFALVSGIIPNVIGKYHKRTYSPNIYVFIVAPPASNKGDLPLLLNFTKPVQEKIRAEYQKSMEAYQQKVAKELEKVSDDGSTPNTPLTEPPLKTLLTPGDISASMLYETMNNNQELGNIMFEPEADVLTQACRNKEWGDYSTGLRKAFHHESIQFMRRTNKEHIVVERPRLSVLISGTPKQVGDLIPNSENGLFSRWAFYAIPQTLEWQDVFAEEEQDYESVIEKMGLEYYNKVYIPLSKRDEPLIFKLKPEQQERFNNYLAEMQIEQASLIGDEIIGTVRRLGLIIFRLAMTLSILRLTETDTKDLTTIETLECDDRDFNTVMEMSNVLISHACSVFTNLLRQPRTNNTETPNSMNYVERKILEQLSIRFTRHEYLEIAKKESVNEKSANRYLGNLVNKHNIATRIKAGVYELIN